MNLKFYTAFFLFILSLNLYAQVKINSNFTDSSLESFVINNSQLSTKNLPEGEQKIGGLDFTVDKGNIFHFDGKQRKGSVLMEQKTGFKATQLGFLHTFQPGQGVHNWRLAVAQAHRNIELPPMNPVAFLLPGCLPGWHIP